MEVLSITALHRLYLQCTTVTTDTRNCPEGSLFVALKGDKFNGNFFAKQALEQGARYVIVDDPACGCAKDDDRILWVEDALKTLQELAHYHRTKLQTKILGITGTNGKTTTKELLAAVLSTRYNLLYTHGNLNNHIGVPLTLLRLRPEHELAVVEMGASHPGDIKELAEIAEPDFGIITNVGCAHLEGFGSLEGVARTKGELYDYLRKKQAVVFVNASHSYLLKMLDGLTPVYYASESGGKGVSDVLLCGRVTGHAPFLSFEWKERGNPAVYAVDTRLIGDYNLDNMLAAATVGLYFHVPCADICRAIREYSPTNNRSQWKVTPHNRLIVDAYNANPTSMRAALCNFSRIEAPRKAVILGDMKELGAASLEEHQSVLRFVGASGWERAIFVGGAFKAAYTEGILSGLFERGNAPEFYDKVEELLAAFHAGGIPQGYTFLIKGSHSVRLFLLAEEL